MPFFADQLPNADKVVAKVRTEEGSCKAIYQPVSRLTQRGFPNGSEFMMQTSHKGARAEVVATATSACRAVVYKSIQLRSEAPPLALQSTKC